MHTNNNNKEKYNYDQLMINNNNNFKLNPYLFEKVLFKRFNTYTSLYSYELG